MDLTQFAYAIQQFGPLQRKAVLPKVIGVVSSAQTPRDHVYADYGEDAAAIDVGPNTFGLIAADGLIPEFVAANPWGAGYSAILVCVDDIYACGGTPLAASIVLSARDEVELDAILAGIKDGSEKFQVPVVRGHTHPDAPSASLSSSIFGTVPKKNFVPAGGAEPGNKIIAIIDPHGRRSPYNSLAWDTTTMKDSETVIAMRQAFQQLANQHLILSAKDISNAGLFGTLLQMLELSRCGANIPLEFLTVPLPMQQAGVTLIEFGQMFLTSSFIACAPTAAISSITTLLEPADYLVMCIGDTIEETSISLTFGEESETLFTYADTTFPLPRYKAIKL